MTANPRTMKRGRSGHPVVLLVPLDKSREHNVDRGLRLEAEIAAGGFDIRKAFRDVAGLERQELFLCGAAELSLEDSDKVEEFFGAVVPEIVNPVRNSLGSRRRAVMRCDRTCDDVVDIGEIAGHSAFVEYLYRFACEN